MSAALMAAVADEIEPDAKALIRDGADDALIASASIAISLRRIADAMDGTVLGTDAGLGLAGLTMQFMRKS